MFIEKYAKMIQNMAIDGSHAIIKNDNLLN